MALSDAQKNERNGILEEAHVKVGAGKRADAALLYKQALDIDPNNVHSLTFLAQDAVRAQRFDDAIHYVKRVIAQEPDVVGHRHSLGLCYDSKGDFDASAKAYREAIELDKGNATSYLFYGCAAAQLKNIPGASSAISAAFQLDPAMIAGPKADNIPIAMRERIEFAAQYLNTVLGQIHLSAVQDTGHRFPGENLKRVEEGVWPGSVDQPMKFKHEQQKPSVFYMSSLKPKAVFDRGSFRWLNELERRTPEILKEFLAAKDEAQSQMALEPHLGIRIDVDDPEFWQAVYLYRNSTAVEENLKLFPKTTKILQDLPLSQLGGKTVSAYFSILAPGAQIPAHFGQTNSHATVHLPLQTNDKARLRVGDKWHELSQAKAFVFDDSFEHSAENKGDEPRVVLVFEVWNPYLSLAERTAVEASFVRRKLWYENRAI